MEKHAKQLIAFVRPKLMCIQSHANVQGWKIHSSILQTTPPYNATARRSRRATGPVLLTWLVQDSVPQQAHGCNHMQQHSSHASAALGWVLVL